MLLWTVLCASTLGGPLRYAEDRAPAIVNPLFATTMSEARLNELVFDGLFTDDKELRSAPALATSITLANDQRSATVALRQDIQWHDGETFTAADVVFTIQAMKNRATASTEAGRVAWISSVEATDRYAVKLSFNNPEYAPENKLHFKILPKHKFKSTTIKRTDAFRNKPVGTGPFMVQGFNDDNSISLTRYQGRPVAANIDEIAMREVADKNYQAKLLLYESLEALVRVLPRDLAALQNDRKIELYPYQTNSWWYIGFNERKSELQDPKVRQAISLMLDVNELLRPIGTGELLSGPFVRSSPFYNHQVPVLSHDGERAAQLLQEAGYTLQGRQWMKHNKPLSLRLATMSNLETAQDVVINMQSQLQTQGVAIEPEFLVTAAWKQRVWRDHDFDLILSQWSFDRNEDIREQFHSRGARNFVGYASEETDRLLDASGTTTDPQEKKALLRQAHAQIAADAPMVFLWTLDSYSALSVKVKDVVVHPFYFFTWASDWNLD